MPLKKVVPEVLKTIKGTSLDKLAEMTVRLSGVSEIPARVSEVDVETITLDVAMEGESVDSAEMREVVERAGGRLFTA